MQCQRCGAECSPEDNFCRRCGMALASRLPTPVRPLPKPVPWSPVRDLVIRGATALAVGTAAELARRRIRRYLNPTTLANAIESWWRQRKPEAPEPRSEPVRVPVRVVKRQPSGPAVKDQPARVTTEGEGLPAVTIVRRAFYRRIQIYRR